MPLEAPPPSHNRDVDEWLNKIWSEFLKLEGQIIAITSTGVSAGTEFSVSHGLAKIPLYVQPLVTEAMTADYLEIRRGTTAWTDTTIYLICDTTNAALSIKVW